MNGVRIHHILSLDPYTAPLFKGFGNPDTPLPNLHPLPSIIILNTAPISSPGEHWCVACFANDGSCNFFDPFGLSPLLYGFGTALLTACKIGIRFSKIPVQGILSKTCAHHCLFFALKYARGYTPDQIMHFYSSNNSVSNDNMVFEYIRRKSGSILATIVE